jgi:septal ring factor EnvC (AmiA/AmiB activator)
MCVLMVGVGYAMPVRGGLDAPLLAEHSGTDAVAADTGVGDYAPTIEGLRGELETAHGRIRELRRNLEAANGENQQLRQECDQKSQRIRSLEAEVARFDGSGFARATREVTGIMTGALRASKKYGMYVTAILVGGSGMISYLMHGCDTCSNGKNSHDATALEVCKKDLEYVRKTELAVCNTELAQCNKRYDELYEDCAGVKIQLEECNTKSHKLEIDLTKSQTDNATSAGYTMLACMTVFFFGAYVGPEGIQQIAAIRN